FFFFQAEDGIRDFHVTGVQTCALPIYEILSDSVFCVMVIVWDCIPINWNFNSVPPATETVNCPLLSVDASGWLFPIMETPGSGSPSSADFTTPCTSISSCARILFGTKQQIRLRVTKHCSRHRCFRWNRNFRFFIVLCY